VPPACSRTGHGRTASIRLDGKSRVNREIHARIRGSPRVRVPRATRHCKDANRRGEHEHTAFTFLGFTFRARPARARDGALFASFQPAVSKEALKKISGEVRRWRLHHWTGLPLAEIARRINPIVRGWMHYYGAFYRSALNPVLQRINAYLMRWLRDKHKRLRPMKKAKAAWQRITGQHPRLFAHWAWASASWWTG